MIVELENNRAEQQHFEDKSRDQILRAMTKVKIESESLHDQNKNYLNEHYFLRIMIFFLETFSRKIMYEH